MVSNLFTLASICRLITILNMIITIFSSFQRKSVSAEVNYGIRFTCESDAHKFISELAGEVEKRLTAIRMKGRCITLKLKVSIV